MASPPFHYLDLRAFCYATEDEPRVEAALRTLLPAEFPIERSMTEGHHGDRIVVLEARVERADEVRTVLDRILETATVAELEGTLTDRMDEDCAFFVRLDKQAAYRGSARLGQGIQLRGKVESYPASREAAIENLATYFAEV